MTEWLKNSPLLTPEFHASIKCRGGRIWYCSQKGALCGHHPSLPRRAGLSSGQVSRPQWPWGQSGVCILVLEHLQVFLVQLEHLSPQSSMWWAAHDQFTPISLTLHTAKKFKLLSIMLNLGYMWNIKTNNLKLYCHYPLLMEKLFKPLYLKY